MKSDDSEKDGKGAVDADHHIVIQRADGGANRGRGNGHDFIDHNLRGLLEAVFRRWLNGKAEKGRIDHLGGQEADRDAPERREEIGLQNEGGPRFAAVMALGGHGDNIAAFHPLSQAAISEMKSRTGFSCADRAARRAWRRHSAENPAARVSGTHICTGRKPLRRNRRRYRLCFSFGVRCVSEGIGVPFPSSRDDSLPHVLVTCYWILRRSAPANWFSRLVMHKVRSCPVCDVPRFHTATGLERPI
ncbi:hypothetical protein NITMOv2_4790 [Nitrospira moscoviensis]|uniref:Uncharacterized protein n=1 Tax=Nitrospira moscoviensis TaxID=42253 RepID=A0A0K2GJM6_NITMO|nr:hypothetical protein NITMOv2_4790 [Nitrospira moscoviensis]